MHEEIEVKFLNIDVGEIENKLKNDIRRFC